MAQSKSMPRESRAFALLCGVAVIVGLWFARDILLPFALGILLSFLLAPVVGWVEKCRCPRIPAVLIVVAISFAGVGSLSSVIGYELYDLAKRLPEYKSNIIHKVDAFRGDGNGVFSKMADAFAEVQSETSRPRVVEADGTPDTAEGAPPSNIQERSVVAVGGQVDRSGPARVEVVNPLSFNEIVGSVFGPVMRPLGTAAIVLVFVVFMLIQREDLRNRLIHLIGSSNLNVTTQALDDAAHRVSRYLVMQLIINALFGLVIGIGLYFIGVPNPLLWGVMAGILRFVPFIGPWIAASIPVALSLAVFDGWNRPILVLGLFVINELISNNVLEPWLYGTSTGISSLGILVSAVFWTWLWGPVGLVMATPLTVCLMVIGRHVPQLGFVNKLLSTQEILPPQDRFYQRLLALDPEEAIEVAEDFLKDHSLEDLYDSVLLPALSLAEQDRHHGDLEEPQERLIIDTLRELVDDLGARAQRAAAAVRDASGGANPTAVAASDLPVLCLPARDEADEIVGMMLAQLLAARGVKTELVSSRILVGEMLTQVAEQSARVVCISALPPFATTHARYLCKRLRPKFPELQIVVGLWTVSAGSKTTQEWLAALNVRDFVNTLADAAEQIARLALQHRVMPVVSTAVQPSPGATDVSAHSATKSDGAADEPGQAA